MAGAVLASRGARWFAAALGVACGLAAAGSVAAAVGVGWSFAQAEDAYVVSNLLIGMGFGLCGAVVAWHRPGLALGWLYAGGGLLQTVSALAAATAQLLVDQGAPTWFVRLDLTVFQWAWPVNIGVALPLALLLLPDGRLASRRWRPVAAAVAVTAPLFVLEIGLSPLVSAGLPNAYLTLAGYDRWSQLWTVSEVRWVASMLVGVACLAIRFRRGSDVVRGQLLWLLTAAAAVLLAVIPWSLVSGTPVAVLFAIPLLPIAVTVGLLRRQLFDIRLVVARGLSYALLSGVVLAGYAVLVIVLSGVASALIVALVALPLRARLQRAIDRLLYGDRADPLRVASRVGRTLTATGLAGTLEEIRTALRLPYVGVQVEDLTVASTGTPDGPTVAVQLVPQDGGAPARDVLVVGLRAGEKRLAPADERILTLLAGPLATAVRATRLSEQLQASRGRLVLAREEERRRLRRELHDGLGPLLTGVAFSADAAANLAAGGSPGDAGQLLAAIRADSRSAIAEVRRIVEDLRPPALDELGLVPALRIRAAQTSRRSDGSVLAAVVEAPAELPPLPAAVEVAAYRIATEALTNTVRHSSASTVVLRLTCDGALCLEVDDDGRGGAEWSPGVGITGMRERVAELGGRCDVGPGPDGGRVRVSLPLAVA